MRLLKDRKPFVAFLMLLFLVVTVGISVMSIGILLSFLIHGTAFVFDTTQAPISQLKYIQVLTQIAFFIAPALVYAFLMQKDILGFFHLKKSPSLLLLLIVCLLILVSMPFNDWLIYINKQIHLPDTMAALENWMIAAEERANTLMIRFLQMHTVGDYIINLLVIGVVASISEELLMRGALQPLFSRWIGNVHWGIWITAFIFSFIHLQFYGFFARMFLGAVLGYLYVYTSNLWVPILAHFFNNGAAVTFVYLTGQSPNQTQSLFESTGQSLWFVVLGSFVMVILGLWYVKKQDKTDKTSILKF